jgi:hypothetical protein
VARTLLAALDRVRAACLALPEVVERDSHGAPTFFAGAKKTFVTFLDDHHGDGRVAIWCAAPLGAQEEALAENPEQFFRPPYVGHRGWLGVRVDGRPDWTEVAEIIEQAYRTVASKTQVAALDARRPSAAPPPAAPPLPGACGSAEVTREVAGQADRLDGRA